MTLSLIAMQAMSGLTLAAIFILLGIGLTLIFGVLEIVNFAHGAMFTLGAYMTVFLTTLTGSFMLAVIAAALITCVYGLLAERLLVRPLYSRGLDYPLLMTFGLSYVTIELIRIAFGPAGIPFGPPPALQGVVDVDFAIFPIYRLTLVLVVAAIVLFLWVLIERTRYGLAIQATARDPEVATVLGLNVPLIRFVIFGLGAMLAGVAGGLAAPIQAVMPGMGIPVLVQAFVVTVIGGMGSLLGAVVAALLTGFLFSATALFAPDMAELSGYVLMAVVLLLRPHGLMGKKGALG